MPGADAQPGGQRRRPWFIAMVAVQLLALAVGVGNLSGAMLWWLLPPVCGLAGLWLLWQGWRREAACEARLEVLQQSAQVPPPELAVLRAQLRASEARLQELMEGLPAGVAVYDNQDRLLALNASMAQHTPYRTLASTGAGAVLGQSHETLLRRAVAAGEVAEAVGQEEEWLARQLAPRAGGAGTRHHHDLGAGRHLFEQRTASGYRVMTRLDVGPLTDRRPAPERSGAEGGTPLPLVDGLTGIANRRLFELRLRQEWQRCARVQRSLSVLLVDIDHFQAYNKQYGPLGGDACLRTVARLLGQCAKRSGELVARFGNDQFVLLLPEAEADEARRVAQRCLVEVHNTRIPHAASPASSWLSLSIGVATLEAVPGQPPERLLRRAEAAMSHAKGAGRSRVEVLL